MKPREVLDRTTTPDGSPLELSSEGGHFFIRVRGSTLMSSLASGSEQAMARVAAEHVGSRAGCRVLVGGLGMGFTCRAALDAFGETARVRVAELLAPIIAYNRGVLGPLADHPLADPRVEVVEGDVRRSLEERRWDAILLDVDNGPDAFTMRSNGELYAKAGVEQMAQALEPGGVLVVWSASDSPRFEKVLAQAGLETETRRVFARAEVRKGARHTLFVARRPERRRSASGAGRPRA